MCLIYSFITFMCFIVAIGAAERLEFLDLIKPYGYTGEHHYVTTIDGYILRIDRITSSPLSPTNQEKPVVYIQHGLISASDHFVFWKPETSLAFALADAGYDVWLGNFRGNMNSRNHTTISPETRRFWNFNIQDLAVKDLPTMIDYVLGVTGRNQLSYVGHSLGTTLSMVLLSERPEYNDKFNIVVYLAPIAYWDPLESINWKTITAALPILAGILKAPDFAVEVFRVGDEIMKLCSSVITNDFCALFMNSFIGNPSVPFNSAEAAYVSQYAPSGASLQIIDHYAQNIHSGRFAKYDYRDKIKNFEHYGQLKPPTYDTTKITAPTATFWSLKDTFIKNGSVKKLLSTLPNVVSNNLVKDPRFTHADYLFHAKARIMYIDKVLQLVDKYKS